jgi:hypothetical protein
MVPLAAEIFTEQLSDNGRGAVRRSLRLRTTAHSSAGADEAMILNISETGLLIEYRKNLEVGETIAIDVPQAPVTAARVVWTDNLLAGCEFVEPISTGGVSAAQLQAPFKLEEPRQQVQAWQVEERTLQTAMLISSLVISLTVLIIFVLAVLPT